MWSRGIWPWKASPWGTWRDLGENCSWREEVGKAEESEAVPGEGIWNRQALTSIKVASHQGSSWIFHQEERVLSEALEASKVLLEEQLEVARERSARLHETQRENLLLRTRLGEAHAVS